LLGGALVNNLIGEVVVFV